jgi:hypothetical protein
MTRIWPWLGFLLAIGPCTLATSPDRGDRAITRAAGAAPALNWSCRVAWACAARRLVNGTQYVLSLHSRAAGAATIVFNECVELPGLVLQGGW